jgi:hypothetical protein
LIRAGERRKVGQRGALENCGGIKIRSPCVATRSTKTCRACETTIRPPSSTAMSDRPLLCGDPKRFLAIAVKGVPFGRLRYDQLRPVERVLGRRGRRRSGPGALSATHAGLTVDDGMILMVHDGHAFQPTIQRARRAHAGPGIDVRLALARTTASAAALISFGQSRASGGTFKALQQARRAASMTTSPYGSTCPKGSVADRRDANRSGLASECPPWRRSLQGPMDRPPPRGCR